ncbi:MAG: hypothetical protein ACTSYR_01415 [Candidatus Odinarchaeia archaeon]
MLIISLIILATASSLTIRAVEKLIEITGLSEVAAGFIILAVLTSTPEMVISIFSVAIGSSGISIGNILGPNIFNHGLILGVFGLLGYLKVCCTNLLLDLTDVLFITSAIPLILLMFGALDPIMSGLLLATFCY